MIWTHILAFMAGVIFGVALTAIMVAAGKDDR